MQNNIEHISRELEVTAHCPPGRNEAHLLESSSHPVVLVNLRPYFNINIIHISLFARIKRIQELGFNVILVLYDNTVLFGNLSEEIQTRADALNAMEYIYDSIIRYGINPHALEVIPESVIWKCQNYNVSILSELVKLAYSIGDKSKDAEKDEPKQLNYYLDIMLGITYEGLLRPDYIFFSGKEVEVWSQIRSRTSLAAIYGTEYLPPIILNIPDIVKYNAPELVGTSDIDDVFSKAFQVSDIDQCVQLFSQEYLESIRIVSVLEGLPQDRPDVTIKTIRKRMYAQ